jgi:hypothetical protein
MNRASIVVEDEVSILQDVDGKEEDDIIQVNEMLPNLPQPVSYLEPTTTFPKPPC